MSVRKDHPLYETWKSMRQRCNNPNHQFYPDYGGRGIQVEPAWDDFWQFVHDVTTALGVTERPEGCTLDRKKPHLNYGPGNVKWSTKIEQNGNRRNCRFIKIGREKKPLAQVARDHDLPQTTLRSRLDRGWTLEDALCA